MAIKASWRDAMSTRAELQAKLDAAKTDTELVIIAMRFTSTQRAILKYGDDAGPECSTK